MMLDNKGKLFGKISIVDLTVIIIVILAVVGIGFNYFIAKSNNSTTGLKSLLYQDRPAVPLLVEVRIDGVREMTVNGVSEGELLYETTRSTILGKAINKSYKPFEDFITLSDGMVKRAPVPDKYSMNLIIAVDGMIQKGEYFTKENQPLVVGATLSLKSVKISTSGTILNINPVEK